MCQETENMSIYIYIKDLFAYKKTIVGEYNFYNHLCLIYLLSCAF